MIYPIIKRVELNHLKAYANTLDFNSLKNRSQQTHFETTPDESAALITYRQLEVMSQHQQKLYSQGKTDVGGLNGGTEPSRWTLQQCAVSLASFDRGYVESLLSSYGDLEMNFGRKKISELTVSELIQALPYILDRAGIKQ